MDLYTGIGRENEKSGHGYSNWYRHEKKGLENVRSEKKTVKGKKIGWKKKRTILMRLGTKPTYRGTRRTMLQSKAKVNFI